MTEGFDCRVVHVDCTGLDHIPQEDKYFVGNVMKELRSELKGQVKNEKDELLD